MSMFNDYLQKVYEENKNIKDKYKESDKDVEINKGKNIDSYDKNDNEEIDDEIYNEKGKIKKKKKR